MLEAAVKERGLALADLKADPKWGRAIPAAPSRSGRGGYNTPSGKIEVYSETLAGIGQDPLPLPPPPPPPEREYPLLLITGNKRRGLINSSFEELPIHTIGHKGPRARLHPETAAAGHLSAGQALVVETPRGELAARAQLDDRIKPGTVCLDSFFYRQSVNVLSDIEERDPISGFPNLRGMRCRLRPA